MLVTALATEVAHADVGVLDGSPWPEMRRDRRNTALSPIRARYRGDRPWSFKTGRGIFSTPVLDDHENVYVGSADGNFYAIGRGGKQRWRFRTGGIIDAAAALGAAHGGRFPITIGSGDETLYSLRGGSDDLSRSRRIAWTFRNRPTAGNRPTGQLVGGQPRLRAGRQPLRRQHRRRRPSRSPRTAGSGGWFSAATPFGRRPPSTPQGNSYWGSVDFFAFSLDPAGNLRWQTFTPGYVTSSPALGSDGTVYVGSFDRAMHALDPATGAERWSFPTADHIYSSAALAADRSGATSAIYIGSADGSVYALRPDGTELWRYDTGDPVRSSPVIGRAPHGDGRIVYVGSSNGRLYALDAETGRRRWSFDTTPNNKALADRNDLNGSPALGKRGVYIGGEHGRLWFVPYDYCRRESAQRCSADSGEEFGDEVDGVYAVTPGGTTLTGAEKVPPATVLATRLVVRRGGRTVDARIDPASGPSVVAEPSFDFSTELSGDGHNLFIRPARPLRPDTRYRIRIAGEWTAGGDHGGFDNAVRVRTGTAKGGLAGLRVGDDRVGALELSRLALPLPSLLPSVNQIGFDSYDLIAGTVSRTPTGRHRGSLLLWVIGARRDEHGRAVADPSGGFAFPLAGTYRRDQVELNASGVNLQFSFGAVPLRSFDFRGALRPGAGFRPGASLYGLVTCGDVPNYSLQLRVAGVCNSSDTLAAYGTFLSAAYERGDANRRPKGVRAGTVTLQPPTATADGEAVATLVLQAGRPLPRRPPPGLDHARRRGHRDPGQPRLPRPDQPVRRRRRRHHRGQSADPRGDGAAEPAARVRDRRRLPARRSGPVGHYDHSRRRTNRRKGTRNLLPIADYGLGEALLTVVSIFFFVIWIWILITILSDLFRDHETSGWTKAAWVFFLVFVPFLTALIYLGVRGSGMRERMIKEQQDAKAQMDDYIRETAASPADEIGKLSALHDSGKLSDEEFAAMKAKVLA